MNLAFRKANVEDIPIVATLLTQATAYKVKRGDLAWDDGAWSEDEVAHDMNRNPMYVALLNKELVGVFILQWKDAMWEAQTDDAGYIHRLAIKDGFHGQNLGGQILDWATSEVIKKGRKYFRLDCPADNEKLCQYYEAQGFTRVAIKPNPMIDGYTAAYFERQVV